MSNCRVTFVSQPFEQEGAQVCLKTAPFAVEGPISPPGQVLLDENFPAHAPWAVIGGGLTSDQPTPVEEIEFTTEDAAQYWPPEGSEGLAE